MVEFESVHGIRKFLKKGIHQEQQHFLWVLQEKKQLGEDKKSMAQGNFPAKNLK